MTLDEKARKNKAKKLAKLLDAQGQVVWLNEMQP
jgi:hypothetical protein